MHPMSTQAQTEQILVGIRDVATMMAVSKVTVRKMARTGRIPGTCRIGKRMKFARPVVLKWLQDGGAIA